MRFVKILVLAAVCALVTAMPARAKSVALLIANSAYAKMGTLRNPVNDIDRIGVSLQALGFEVRRATNLSRADMTTALLNFAGEARGADTAMIFYSGHGFEADGVNYLIPVDYAPNHPSEVRFSAIRLDDAMDAVAGATRLSVVVLDACRDNPLASSTRGGSRGLGTGDSEPSQVVAYSTAPGALAQDGVGNTSPYTQALAEMMERRPNIDVRQLFTSLSARTTELARTRQTPYAEFGAFSAQHVSLTGAAPATATALPPPVVPDRNAEMLALWNAVKDSSDASALEQFVSSYPDSPLAAEAQRRVAAIGPTVPSPRYTETPSETGNWQNPQPTPTTPQASLGTSEVPVPTIPQGQGGFDGSYNMEMSCSAVRGSSGFVRDLPITVSNGAFRYETGSPGNEGYAEMSGQLDASGNPTIRGTFILDSIQRRIRFDAQGELRASGKRGRRYCETVMRKN